MCEIYPSEDSKLISLKAGFIFGPNHQRIKLKNQRSFSRITDSTFKLHVLSRNRQNKKVKLHFTKFLHKRVLNRWLIINNTVIYNSFQKTRHEALVSRQKWLAKKAFFCSCISSRVMCCVSSLSFLCRELGGGRPWNERRVCGTRVSRLEGEASEGLANLLVYGSTLLFQGQR